MTPDLEAHARRITLDLIRELGEDTHDAINEGVTYDDEIRPLDLPQEQIEWLIDRVRELIPTATVTIALGLTEQDAATVREFAEHRAELRAARARGTRLCGAAPGDRDLAWHTCTHDIDADGDHDGEHSWYRDRP